MKAIKNWNTQEAEKEFIPLPANGYICKIMGIKEHAYQNCSVLVVSIDIAEGEFKDYYAEDYRNQQQEDKKWKGNLRLYIPDDDNPGQYEESTRRRFKSFTNAVEDSNPNLKWDWETLEKDFKNKFIGIVFRNEQWVYEGKSGWKAQPFKCVSIQDIRDGNFNIPKDKPNKNVYVESSTPEFVDANNIDDEDLPF